MEASEREGGRKERRNCHKGKGREISFVRGKKKERNGNCLHRKRMNNCS